MPCVERRGTNGWRLRQGLDTCEAWFGRLRLVHHRVAPNDRNARANGRPCWASNPKSFELHVTAPFIDSETMPRSPWVAIVRRMRVLVTGAGGFLGTHICQYFGSRGHAIAALGRFAADEAVAERYPGLELLLGMTLPDPAFARALDAFRPEVVVHCAASALVADSVKRPYRDFRRSVDVCAYVLHTLHARVPDCAFVLLSSASVYGNPQTLPTSEQAPCTPASPYGYHKWLSELVTEEYRTLFGMRTAVLRIFSAYGERLGRQVVYDLCRKMTGPDSDVRVFGTGHESRDFVHAHDVAQAVLRVVSPAADAAVYNVATGVETTIVTLAETLAKLLRCEKPIVFTGEELPGYPINWRADISRLSALGYRPEVTLEDGLAAYCRWFLASKQPQKS
ncbi:MAG: NAD-dependent epimerase/dehydratase family protein [Myxococcales bacterium]|nr:NAD-dependent epimerase/dehydratase family protein [Myxococcales bacterium]